jgi:hypothetical protein
MAVSRDESSLFVASSQTTPFKDVLRVFSLASGALELEAPLEQPGQTQRRVLHTGFACCPDLATTSDNQRLYVNQVTPGDEGEQVFMVGTFDLAAGRMLPQSVPLGHFCGPAVLLPREGTELSVVCTRSAELFFLDIGDTGAATSVSSLRLTPDGADPVAWAVMTSDGASIYVVTETGRVLQVDASNQTIAASATLPIGQGRRVSFGKVFLTPKGDRLVIGLRPREGIGVSSADAMLRVNVDDWSGAAVLTLPAVMESLTIDASGETAHGIDMQSRSLMTVALSNGDVVSRVEGVGASPQQVISGG